MVKQILIYFKKGLNMIDLWSFHGNPWNMELEKTGETGPVALKSACMRASTRKLIKCIIVRTLHRRVLIDVGLGIGITFFKKIFSTESNVLLPRPRISGFNGL